MFVLCKKIASALEGLKGSIYITMSFNSTEQNKTYTETVLEDTEVFGPLYPLSYGIQVD